MTPKEQYEARKAERNKLKDMDYQLRQRTEQLMLMDMLDRFVIATECIAAALERAHTPVFKFEAAPIGGGGVCAHGVSLQLRCAECASVRG